MSRVRASAVCLLVAMVLTAVGAVLLPLGLRIPADHPVLVGASLLTGAAFLLPASVLLFWFDQNFVQSHFAISMSIGYVFNTVAWACLLLLLWKVSSKVRRRLDGHDHSNILPA